MTVTELKESIDRELAHRNKKDAPVLITIKELLPSCGARASTEVKCAGFGIDWESGQFRLTPQDQLCKLNETFTSPARMRVCRYNYPTRQRVVCHCPRCETTVSKDDRFCRRCGQKIVYEDGVVDHVMEVK